MKILCPKHVSATKQGIRLHSKHLTSVSGGLGINGRQSAVLADFVTSLYFLKLVSQQMKMGGWAVSLRGGIGEISIYLLLAVSEINVS